MLSLFKIQGVIDGKKVKVSKGATILEAAQQAGIEIPTLCHVPGCTPTGVCRVCVVEVQGQRTLQGACHTPFAAGMAISTRSPKVLSVRRAVVELLLAAHTGACVNDENAERCLLHTLASDHEVGAPRFDMINPRSFPMEEANPHVVRNLAKCILCRRCITACTKLAGKAVIGIGFRGFKSKLITGFDEPLTSNECRDCGICIEYCPTGALSRPGDAGRIRERPVTVRSPKELTIAPVRKELLPMLKEKYDLNGRLSREVMEKVAGDSGLSLTDVFGVSSFYAYLPRDAGGKHRIRICRCVPCDLKDAKAVIGGIRNALGIGPGETTADGKFSLEVVGCIGACDQAPAMMVGDELHGNLTAERVDEILKSYAMRK